MILNAIIWLNILLQIFTDEIINNPVFICNTSNPKIIYTPDEYFIYSQGKIAIFNRTNHIFMKEYSLNLTDQFIFCKDKSNNVFIYKNKNFSQINIISVGQSITWKNVNSTSRGFIGYIAENEYNSNSEKKGKCNIEYNEISYLSKIN